MAVSGDYHGESFQSLVERAALRGEGHSSLSCRGLNALTSLPQSSCWGSLLAKASGKLGRSDLQLSLLGAESRDREKGAAGPEGVIGTLCHSGAFRRLCPQPLGCPVHLSTVNACEHLP